ncbi:MAG: glycolate oxidase subunit GlcF [Pseudomonadota bacterium]|nr:glycolate oxidase subunit GlcF [Pseudomonadota bacterium]
MQTKLSPEFSNTPQGIDAEAILRSCVHCGFCNATCPTYQILGDELDGPRGRIYLIKQLLEGSEVGRSTQQHLDRCLTCLACETTCPSGVQYGKLVSIGRALVEERVRRPWRERLQRWALKEGLTSSLFGPALRLGRSVQRMLPAPMRKYVSAPRAPGRAAEAGRAVEAERAVEVGGAAAVGRAAEGGGAAKTSRLAEPRGAVPMFAPRHPAGWPQGSHERKVLLLAGCVQPAMMPNINGATARVLDAAGIQALVAAGAGCCGALRDHLSDHEGSLADARRNIDAWWPLVAADAVEAIVMNASACGLAVKQYGETLRHDPGYAAKAARISAMACDVSELLPELLPKLVPLLEARPRIGQRLTFHAPCTLQHGQRLRGGVEAHLALLGFDVHVAASEGHLCCGSAGTYSVLQPALARELRDRKLAHLTASSPRCIVSANIGCIQHLQSGTDVPVRHWIEVLDESLGTPAAAVARSES